MKCRIGFIGAGNLASAVIRGLLRANFCAADEIIGSQPDDELRERLRIETGIRTTTDNKEVAQSADTILLGVKPGLVLRVIREIGPVVANKLVISLAAGIRLSQMEAIAEARFLRVMTNLPATICHAATAFAPGLRTNDKDAEWVRSTFGAIGTVAAVSEENIDAVTALAGSGPAFVYSVIEALAMGGRSCGLPSEIALSMATQTVRGAAEMVAVTSSPPADLRKMVVTPGGTTAAGLEVMQQRGTTDALIAAVEAATARAREMAKQFSE